MKQLPIDFSANQLSRDERIVWALIQDRHGREAAISVRELCEATGLEDHYVRKLVRELIMIHGRPIGSLTTRFPGYFVITSADELLKVRNSLTHRAVAILNRARAFDRSGLLAKLSGQLEMTLK